MSQETDPKARSQPQALTLLGQVIPLNAWTAIIVALVCATVLLALWLSLRSGVQLQIQSGTFLYSLDGEKVRRGTEQRLLVFWTPSKQTKLDVERNQEKVQPYYDVGDDEGRIKRFADELVRRGALGYNRFEVTGRGTTPEKRGYLWRVTANAWNPAFTGDAFVKFYSQYWDRKENIYLEEYDFSEATRRSGQ
jgi:hypothetical protein